MAMLRNQHPCFTKLLTSSSTLTRHSSALSSDGGCGRGRGRRRCRGAEVPSLAATASHAWLSSSSSSSFSLLPHCPPAVRIVEVGPRDGLQNEASAAVSTSNKVTFIQKLVKAGCRHVETGSFVSPKRVPSMADSLQVMQALHPWKKQQRQQQLQNNNGGTNDETPPKDDVIFSCLVPNSKGFRSALEAHVDEIAIFASASEAFSRKNINCSIAESLKRFEGVVTLARERDIPVRAYLSCVLGCPYQGSVKPVDVARVTEQLLALDCCREISLGDTIGVGTPASTAAMLQEVMAVVDAYGGGDEQQPQLAVHFHDTYGQALANILVSLERGIAVVDSSVAGLGGCPYAGANATGNVATEDVVYMLHGMGVTTGIDLESLVMDAGAFITERVLKRPTRSKVAAAMIAKRKAQQQQQEQQDEKQQQQQQSEDKREGSSKERNISKTTTDCK